MRLCTAVKIDAKIRKFSTNDLLRETSKDAMDIRSRTQNLHSGGDKREIEFCTGLNVKGVTTILIPSRSRNLYHALLAASSMDIPQCLDP